MHLRYKAFYQGHPEVNWHICYTYKYSYPQNPENVQPHSSNSIKNATPFWSVQS